jgi:hypothetical protein
MGCDHIEPKIYVHSSLKPAEFAECDLRLQLWALLYTKTGFWLLSVLYHLSRPDAAALCASERKYPLTCKDAPSLSKCSVLMFLRSYFANCIN